MSELIAIELELPSATYAALQQAAQRTRKTETEIALAAIEAYLKQLAAIDPLLGLFADEPELIEAATEDAMQSRESTPLRI